MKNTDKKVLMTGIKFMALSLPLMFLAPYLITLGFLNKDNSTFYIFFPIGLIIGIAAVYFAFKGILTIMKSIFH
ncbi:DUF6095 family protein [Planktosalinus lacus]|uniref:Uncharacterized protein n=1 Tax=Planktosalinus lacus TaxID=1526573 RepID=A0A8J2V976_9FLAO|nr:DUF6095 family protein [Planktosalinus lacus]GGD90741.1 hypothetical protein GCM10011312_13200 [Planktosalinus lacus]